jgi:hypothetical protein
MDGVTVSREAPVLSVEENIRIYGGNILYAHEEKGGTVLWDVTPEFAKDIDNIWSVCRRNVRSWNTQISVFEAIEAAGTRSADGLTTTVKKSAVSHWKVFPDLISRLVKKGLICWTEQGDTVVIRYKNEDVKRCLTKAGQALEMKIFRTARSLKEENGDSVYNDALTGVVIDWDGEFHDESEEQVFDTENEIDVMLMHDAVPVFISCKNGGVTAEELYKLNTVAERFGGEYAKKVLVATQLSATNAAGKYFRQRAADMKIQIIDKATSMSARDLEQTLANLWRN